MGCCGYWEHIMTVINGKEIDIHDLTKVIYIEKESNNNDKKKDLDDEDNKKKTKKNLLKNII